MARRILYVLVVVAVIVLAYLGYTRWSQNHAMASGDVYGDAGSSDPTADGASVKPAAVQAPVQPATYPAAKTASATQPAVSQAAVPQSASAPSTDSINPNPPNGAVFAGTGRYQVYRQGNLTWRLDTNTGRTCVLLATNEEWKKAEVYRWGCGTRGVQ
jgi:hypothetical protein